VGFTAKAASYARDTNTTSATRIGDGGRDDTGREGISDAVVGASAATALAAVLVGVSSCAFDATAGTGTGTGATSVGAVKMYDNGFK
jgi:hypothetical protein